MKVRVAQALHSITSHKVRVGELAMQGKVESYREYDRTMASTDRASRLGAPEQRVDDAHNRARRILADRGITSGTIASAMIERG